jgi:hypothetical protein
MRSLLIVDYKTSADPAAGDYYASSPFTRMLVGAKAYRSTPRISTTSRPPTASPSTSLPPPSPPGSKPSGLPWPACASAPSTPTPDSAAAAATSAASAAGSPGTTAVNRLVLREFAADLCKLRGPPAKAAAQMRADGSCL